MHSLMDDFIYMHKDLQFIEFAKIVVIKYRYYNPFSFGFSVNIDAMEQELPSEPDRIQVVSESPSASVEERVDGTKQSSKGKTGASVESDSLLSIKKGTAVKVEKRCVKYY